MAIITKCYLYLLYYKLYISFFAILLTFRKQRAIITKSSGTTDNWTVGVDDVEGPPVPMPNTEVKLNGAEDTWMVTSRKNRKMPTYKSSHPIGWLFFVLIFPVSKSIIIRKKPSDKTVWRFLLLLHIYGNTAQRPPCGLAPLLCISSANQSAFAFGSASWGVT